ncbi:MAG: GNAT family N-acetyltransferase [Flavobacteriales bacterium]|nr:GNAT family N-acetyltransferase [Flavobacteriales bacterium]
MITLPIPSLNGLLTERLRFRKLVAADVEWWIDYINDAEAIRFMPFTVGSRADCEEMIQRALDRYAEDGSGLNAVLLRDSGTPIGMCGLLTQTVDGAAELEIGYHFLPAHWGHGYAAEAAIACKRFAEERALVRSVISLIDEDNLRSQAVARRNGMLPVKRTIHRDVPAVVFRAMLSPCA